MTYAWYGHLKNAEISWWKAVLIGWGIAFFEYLLMVPANRLGYLSGNFTASQLKIVQEVISLSVFAIFALFYLKEKLTWNYFAAFLCILMAVFFMFKK
jgi:uncharacterized protein (DUF486 family)